MMNNLLQVRVIAKERAAADIAAFELEPVGVDALPLFEAGAHIDVHVPDGPVRQYSLCRLPDDPPRYRIGVLRDPGSRGGSLGLVERVEPGDVLSVSVPRNHFPLRQEHHRAVLVAGGIGITPIMCMAQQLQREGREFELHYCGRSLARMAFLDDLHQAPYAERVFLHADDGPEAERFDVRATLGACATDRHLYVCGPAGFMDSVLAAARELGWPEAHLHREYFAAAPIDHSADGPFEIELSRSGTVIAVGAEQSAAEALLGAGIDLSVSCEQGVCGTCLTPVLEGVPDHRDLYLTDDERLRNDQFLPCCSRAQTPRLVLDI